MKPLFLHPPSYDGFDGGAGAQVSLAAPYPGTELYRQAVANGWLAQNSATDLVNERGIQLSPISYPHLSAQDIFHAVQTFCRRCYFRPRKLGELLAEMMGSWDLAKRRLREGVEFFRFLRAHEA